jgi:hypothetical protein
MDVKRNVDRIHIEKPQENGALGDLGVGLRETETTICFLFDRFGIIFNCGPFFYHCNDISGLGKSGSFLSSRVINISR